LDGRVLVRAAEPGEFTAVGEIRVRAYVAGGHLPAASQYAATLRQLGTAGDGQILVAAADGGEIAGTVTLQLGPNGGELIRANDEAEIRALAVVPGRQGRGTGWVLLQAAIELAVASGVRHLLLFTLPSMQAAQRLYQRAGFTRLADRDWSPAPAVTLLAYGLLLGPAG
jgi:ribosomal protein S18 acetylase RimI-like enzyme